MKDCPYRRPKKADAANRRAGCYHQLVQPDQILPDAAASTRSMVVSSGKSVLNIPSQVPEGAPAQPKLAPEVRPPVQPGSSDFGRMDWLSFGLTTLLALIVYLFTLAPEVTLEMSGELATAALHGGVAHNPGFPVWSMYGWVFTKVLPGSNIAWRLGVSSAVAAALTCGVVALMVSRFGGIMLQGLRRFERLEATGERILCVACACIAGLVFGFSRSAWEVAVIVDHRALETLLFCLVICFLVRWSCQRRKRQFLYVAFFLYGLTVSAGEALIPAALGLPFFVVFGNPRLGRDLLFAAAVLAVGIVVANHWDASPLPLFSAGGKVLAVYQGIALVTGSVCVGLIISTRSLLTEWRSALSAGFLSLAGLAPHICLPLASMTNPPMNWGYPRVVEGFFHVLTRGQYEKLTPTASLDRLMAQLGAFVEVAAGHFGFVPLLIALVPFCFLHRMRLRDRRIMLGLLAIFISFSGLMVILLNPAPDRQAQELVEQYFLASYILTAVWTGYGVLLLGTILARTVPKAHTIAGSAQEQGGNFNRRSVDEKAW